MFTQAELYYICLPSALAYLLECRAILTPIYTVYTHATCSFPVRCAFLTKARWCERVAVLVYNAVGIRLMHQHLGPVRLLG